MNSQLVGLRVAGGLFEIMALAQLSRLLIRPEIRVAGHRVPLWPSGLAFLATASLGGWLLQLSRPEA